MQNYNNKKKNIIIGYLVLAVSIALLSFNYFNEKKEKVFNDMNLEYYALANPVEQKDNKDNQKEESTEKVIESETTATDYSNYFIGTLEIPKIGLNKGFVDIDSPDNNIGQNVTIIKTSDMPDVEGGNFILAAHSGTAYISYFRNLYLLNKGDYAYITYNGVKYTYQITNIYLQAKTGQIGIYRDMSKTTLTLVTCTKDDESTQTVYIAELVNKG